MSDDESPHNSIEDILLEHDTRRAIYNAIEEHPGPTNDQLADDLDTHPEVIDYHVQRLVLHGLLLEVRNVQDDDVLFFHPEQVQPWADDEACTLLGRLPLQTVAAYVAEHPGTTAEQTAHAFDRDPKRIDPYLRTLHKNGLVQIAGTGPQARYEPTDTLEPWLAKRRTPHEPNDPDEPDKPDEPDDPNEPDKPSEHSAPDKPGDEEQTNGDES